MKEGFTDLITVLVGNVIIGSAMHLAGVLPPFWLYLVTAAVILGAYCTGRQQQ